MTSRRFNLGSGHELTVNGEGDVLYDGEPISLRELSRRWPVDSKVWSWLRAHGLRRVSTSSGPSGKTIHRVRRIVSLSAEDAALLDILADRLGCGFSDVVARALHDLDAATKESP